MDTARAKVINPDQPRHVLFEGLVSDAKKFVERNFPRPHGNSHDSEATYPVQLVHTDGSTQTFHAEEGWHDPENVPAKKEEPVMVEPTAPTEPVEPAEPVEPSYS